MSERKGFFITLEGPEGSGKSTQARWLVQRLRRAGRRVVWLQDPGSTPVGCATRQLLLHTTTPLSPLAEALLFIGGRVQLVEERIRPALAKGDVVVCDRFHDSTVVYQGYGGGVHVPWLDRLGRHAIHGVMPHLTIVLDLPTAQGFARLRRSHDRMERKTRQFHQQVRRGYLQLARRDPRRVVIVDASKSVDAVRAQLESLIMKRIHP
ncbi:MAG: dTMP kinase [Candidatus Omnitrophica bacterium]|nr:dTMP kinase [Candidatus Omnitrophota bacterium]